MNKLKTDVRFASPDEVEAAVSSALRSCLAGQMPEALILSGNGEPTLHPQFPDIVDKIISVRQQVAPGLPIMVLSNGSCLDSRRIVESLNRLDERVVKMDAGNEQMFRQINAPLVRTSVTKLINGMRGLKDVIIQSLFVQGAVDNTTPQEIDDWIEVVALIKPKLVQICGLNRAPSNPDVRPVDEDTLYTIASKLDRKTRIPTKVFP